jgi:hypothetical protein
MEGLWNVHTTAISSARSPSRLCGSLKAGGHGCPRWVAPIKHSPEIRANQGGEPGRSHDTIAAQCLVMQGPHGCPIFASVFWPRYPRYSSEALAITVRERNPERDIQEVYPERPNTNHKYETFYSQSAIMLYSTKCYRAFPSFTLGEGECLCNQVSYWLFTWLHCISCRW